jgi:hypothetical protein
MNIRTKVILFVVAATAGLGLLILLPAAPDWDNYNKCWPYQVSHGYSASTAEAMNYCGERYHIPKSPFCKANPDSVFCDDDDTNDSQYSWSATYAEFCRDNPGKDKYCDDDILNPDGDFIRPTTTETPEEELDWDSIDATSTSTTSTTIVMASSPFDPECAELGYSGAFCRDPNWREQIKTTPPDIHP